MSIINDVFGVPLGWLFYFCYHFLGDYGLSILLFTLLIKIITFPISMASQINGIKMVKLQPLLEELKERYFDNSKLYMQEMKNLYRREKYNSFIGTVPLLIQIPIILGVINVMYNPLQHLLHIDQTTITNLIAKATELSGGNPLGFGGQLRVMELVQADPGAFAALADGGVLNSIAEFDLNFWGMNLSAFPSFTSPLLLVAIASAASALLMCVLQNRYYVLSRMQGPGSKWGVTIFLVIFSGYFAFVVPVGIGVFWVASNLLTIAVLFLCNWLYNPKKYINFENRTQKNVKLTKEEKTAQKQAKAEAKEREKKDVARFYAARKQLVFYSEGSGFYKYFKSIIEYVLDHSDITVHYVTSDLKDQVFAIRHPRFETYYVAGNGLIAFMMRMDADMVIMTMPDLQQYQIKRSLIRKDAEYIYLDHGMTSFHMMLREGALDNYDTIFCYGPNHIEEIRALEKVYGLPEKKLVETGYGLLDEMLLSAKNVPSGEKDTRRILIAPSWQKDNLLEYCLSETLDPLLGCGYTIILRPHPEFIKRFPSKMKAILAQYGDKQEEGLIIETDFASNETVTTADVVITDWSSIAQEFSYTTKKPSLFINTPMKIMNPEYKKIPLEPLDITLRNEIGISVDVENLKDLPDLIAQLLDKHADYAEKISQILDRYIFNIGSSAQVSGDYIIQTIQGKEKKGVL